MNKNDYSAITLGQLIDTLAAADQTLIVPNGFGEPDSWRGIYAFLRFDPKFDVSVGSMLEYARNVHNDARYTVLHRRIWRLQ
jgi:hypothetical protein